MVDRRSSSGVGGGAALKRSSMAFNCSYIRRVMVGEWRLSDGALKCQ